MKEEFYLIPGRPVTKKNSSRICVNKKTGQRFVRQSKAYEQYEDIALFYLPHPEQPITYPVNVKCVYYMDTKRLVDLSNLIAATHDILSKAHIIADDNRNIIASVDGSRVFYDRVNPRVEITITPVEGYQQWAPASAKVTPRRKKK